VFMSTVHKARWIVIFDYIKELKSFLLYHAFYTEEEFISL
jgi:hypothetical protein